MRLFRFGDFSGVLHCAIMLIRIPLPEEVEDEPEGGYVQIPDWHRAILDERMAKYRADGFIEGRPLEEFEQEIDKMLEEGLTKRLMKS